MSLPAVATLNISRILALKELGKLRTQQKVLHLALRLQ
jgi:hypothetical protein